MSSSKRGKEVIMMSRPKNKEEYRPEIAEPFANDLLEYGLEWKKE